MIRYQDINDTMTARGIEYTPEDYYFVLAVTLGDDPVSAYCTIHDYEEYSKVKDTEKEREYLAEIHAEVNTLLQKQHIVQLKDELEYRYKKEVQDAALNLDDIELTSSDVKKILASFLRDRVDDPSGASVKELVDLLRMYQPYLPDDNAASDFQRHFIQVHSHFNALCTNCNHEINAFKGLHCTCEHCGQKFVWSEEEQRFYPKIDKL